MNRVLAVLVVISGLLLVAGCNKSDLSTPQSAAESFAKAMEAGDVEAAKAASTGGDPKAIESMAKTVHAFKSLREASTAKFGDKGSVVAGPNSARGDLVNQIKDAAVKIDGDTATLTPKSDGRPMKLKKVDGNWKVDASEMSGASAALGGGLMDGMAKAAQETADEIKAGKYATAEEAKAALGKKMLGDAFKGLGKIGSKP